MKTCDEVRENLIEFADNTLAPPEAETVASHLEQCSACRAELDAIRAVFGMMRDSDPADPGEIFWRKFRNQVQDRILAQEQPARRPETRRPRRFPAAAARAAMAAALLLAVFAGYRFFNTKTSVTPPASVKQTESAAAVKPAPREHTHEERVLMATLDNVSIAPVAKVASEIHERKTQQDNPVAAEPVQSVDAVQEFPFDVEDTAALAAEADDTIYLFDDSLTGEYIIPEVLDELTDQEAQAVLDSLEDGSSSFPAENSGSVS